MKERDYSLDFLRLTAMLLVVMIHYSNYYCRYLEDVHSVSFGGAILYNGLARISVPVFFMLSGALMLNQDVNMEKLKKKILRFLLVLIFWTAFYFVWDILYMDKSFELENIVGWIFEPTKPHLWFMYAIIALYIALPFAKILVDHMGEKEENLFIVLWLFFSGGAYLLQVILSLLDLNVSLIYSVPIVQGSYYLGYFVVGNILYNRIRKGSKISSGKMWALYGITTGINIVGTFVMSYRENVYFEDFFAYRNVLVELSAVAVFVLAIQKVSVRSEKMKLWLRKLSPCLFGVYLIHILFYNILLTNVDLPAIFSWIGIPLETIGTFGVSLLAVYLIQKIPVFKKLV